MVTGKLRTVNYLDPLTRTFVEEEGLVPYLLVDVTLNVQRLSGARPEKLKDLVLNDELVEVNTLVIVLLPVAEATTV